MIEEISHLLDNTNSIELGLLLAEKYPVEFNTYFECNLDDYKKLLFFVSKCEGTESKKTLKSIENLSLFGESAIFLANIHLLKNLEYLMLSNNSLTTLPKEISNLNKLKEIELYDNPIVSLPKELKDMKKCQISFSSNISKSLYNQLKDWENIFFLKY